jgi:hypothetical protein
LERIADAFQLARQAGAERPREERLTIPNKQEGQSMKRWLILMAMVVAMMSVASAKRVYYPNRWDDPLERPHETVQVP